MKKIIATIAAYLLYQTNHLLRFLADILASNHLDQLSTRYSNWYNKYLISAVVNFSSVKNGKSRSVEIINIETVDTLLIAEVHYKGLTLVELQKYLIQSLSVISLVNPDHIQVIRISANHAKIIFPMVS